MSFKKNLELLEEYSLWVKEEALKGNKVNVSPSDFLDQRVQSAAAETLLEMQDALAEHPEDWDDWFPDEHEAFARFIKDKLDAL